MYTWRIYNASQRADKEQNLRTERRAALSPQKIDIRVLFPCFLLKYIAQLFPSIKAGSPWKTDLDLPYFHPRSASWVEKQYQTSKVS